MYDEVVTVYVGSINSVLAHVTFIFGLLVLSFNGYYVWALMAGIDVSKLSSEDHLLILRYVIERYGTDFVLNL